VFQTVDDAVRVIVGGVHTPLVTGVRVRHVLDTIRDLCEEEGKTEKTENKLRTVINMDRCSRRDSLDTKQTTTQTYYNNYLVPHVGVGGEHVHLHAQSGLVRSVLALAHVLELPQRLLDGSNDKKFSS